MKSYSSIVDKNRNISKLLSTRISSSLNFFLWRHITSQPNSFTSSLDDLISCLFGFHFIEISASDWTSLSSYLVSKLSSDSTSSSCDECMFSSNWFLEPPSFVSKILPKETAENLKVRNLHRTIWELSHIRISSLLPKTLQILSLVVGVLKPFIQAWI